MKTLKKTLCLVLAVVMAVGVLVIPANAAEFTDADEITHDEAVAVLSGLGIVNGVGDGSFNPDGTFTRAQAAALLANVVLTPDYAAILDSDKAVFSDVPVTNGYNKYITWAVENDYIHGYTDGTFKPNKELTGTELAALMLEVLGEELDAANYKNFVNTTAKKYGLTDGITGYVASSVISRDDAVQMMFNTMNYSKAGVAYKVASEDGKTNYGTYPSRSEAQTIVAILLATKSVTAKISAVKDPSASIMSSVYETTNNPSDQDVFGRPSNVWTDSDDNVLYSKAQEAVLEYDGPVTFKEIYADLGATKETTAKLYIDGLLREDNDNLKVATKDSTDTDWELATNESGKVGVADKNSYGVETYVYEAGKVGGVMTYTIVQMIPYYATIKKVADVEKNHSGVKVKTATFTPAVEGQYVKVDLTSTKFVDFAEKDYVIFNGYAAVSDDTVDAIGDAYKLDTVTGTLSKAVTKNGVTVYTIGGNDYNVCYAHGSLADLDKSVGAEVTVRVDKHDNIVDVVKAALATPKYILVLNAQKIGNDGWTTATSASTAQVYGILSDGTYGIYTVNYTNKSYMQKAPETGVYQYNTNANGELLLIDNTASKLIGTTGSEITNGTASVGVTFKDTSVNGSTVLNSSTLFVYYTTNDNKTVKTLTTRVGNTNCGKIAAGALVGLNSTDSTAAKVASVVFVSSDYSASVSASEYAFIKSTTPTIISGTDSAGNSVTTYHYTGYKSNGDTVDLIAMVDSSTYVTDDQHQVDVGLYRIYSDNTFIVSKVTEGAVTGTNGEIVSGTVDKVVGSVLSVKEKTASSGSEAAAAHNFSEDICVFTGDNKNITNGNKYWAIVNTQTDSFVTIWFYGD